AHHFSAETRINRYEDVLSKEAPGILNWLIQGWQDYRQNGLGEYPASVSVAMEEYRNECDVLAQFMQESYLKLDGTSVPLKNVVRRVHNWVRKML
ncbi:MAG: hypothetical protein LRZ88_00650, partial [Candidatus Cloacimonetes bacterium]|nr:hypothetical protein [Candidatus Cloacimonadota bacterium]